MIIQTLKKKPIVFIALNFFIVLPLLFSLYFLVFFTAVILWKCFFDDLKIRTYEYETTSNGITNVVEAKQIDSTAKEIFSSLCQTGGYDQPVTKRKE